MARRWRVHAFDEGCVRDLSRAANVSSIVAQLLICRGMQQAHVAREFLEAKLSALRDPDALPGLTDASRRVHAAILAGRRITVYGDYDADGICGAAILWRCLRSLGADCDFYVPNRLDEGYGVNLDAVRKLADRGTSLIITVDCGITSVAEAALARQLGVEFIVTDHHQPGDRLPDADGLVHPGLPQTTYPFAGLCGAGVAFKFAWSLCREAAGSTRVSDASRGFLLSAVGLAAIGTVADVVPLVDENRVLVRQGLISLKSHPFAGVEALLTVTRLSARPSLSSEDVAFQLGPRLNAAGRLGQAELGVELLTTDDPARAADLASYLDGLNQERDHLERTILRDAKQQVAETFEPQRDAAIVLGSRDWHPGVIGIVAGRLAERYHRPCVLIAFDELGGQEGVGSGRSALGVNLVAALDACSEHLLRHGGHAAAAGLKIRRDNLSSFRQAFCQYVDRAVPANQRSPELRIDAEAPLPQLTLRTVDQIQQLAPFGQSNPRPVLCTTEVLLDGPPKCMGEGNRHLSLRLKQHTVSLRAVAFGQGEWADSLQRHAGPIDIAYRPVINEFNGRRSVELHLVDWRPTTPTNP